MPFCGAAMLGNMYFHVCERTVVVFAAPGSSKSYSAVSRSVWVCLTRLGWWRRVARSGLPAARRCARCCCAPCMYPRGRPAWVWAHGDSPRPLQRSRLCHQALRSHPSRRRHTLSQQRPHLAHRLLSQQAARLSQQATAASQARPHTPPSRACCPHPSGWMRMALRLRSPYSC